MSPRTGPRDHSRRTILRMGSLAAVALPYVASCEGGYATDADPLLPLLRAARADAAAARELAATGTDGDTTALARAVARVRNKQAQALHAEIERLNRPMPESETTRRGDRAGRADSVRALGERLAESHQRASSLVPTLPPHRAGLVGAVAAGCTGLRQLDPELGAAPAGSAGSRQVPSVSIDKLTTAAVTGLRQALAAEYAAIWIYGLVTAFLPGAFTSSITEARNAHRAHREAARAALTAAGTQPPPAEPAYIPAEPVNDKQSAMHAVVTAEADAAEAWHGVLVRTDDTGLRKLAEHCLYGSARRATRWRDEAGTRPAALALPGTP